MITFGGWDTFLVGGAHTLIMFSGRGTYTDHVQWAGHTLSGLTLTICSAITTIPITKWAVPTGCSERENKDVTKHPE